MSKQSSIFVKTDSVQVEDLGEGLSRKILTFNENLMVVEVMFAKGAVGTMHSHPHTQCAYVKEGSFKVTIGDETSELNAGDSFLVAANIEHGAVAVTEGVLIDIFTPCRDDFLESR